MTDRTPLTKLRRKILTGRGIATTAPRTKRPLTEADLPDPYPKSPHMKYLEIKYTTKLELVIFKGSLSDICQRFNWEVDRSTISRWRKHIQSYIGKVYYE